MASASNTSAYVDALYKEKFGREPDAAGKAYWTAQLNSGSISRDSVEKSFDASEEAQNRTTNNVAAGVAAPATVPQAEDFTSNDNDSSNDTVQQQINQIYNDKLERDADDSGMGYWVAEYNAATDKTAALQNISKSIEASTEADDLEDNKAFLEDIYTNELDRTDDDGDGTVLDEAGKKHWLKDLATGQTKEQVASNIRQSQEFDTQAEAFLDTQYDTLLDRDLGDEGRDYWKDQLKSGQSRTDVVDNIKRGDEYFLNETYKELLGRPLGDEGRTYWRDDLNNGQSREDVTNNIKLSPEYACHQQGKTYDHSTDTCGDAQITCGTGEVLINGQCVAKPTCSANQSYDSASNSCVDDPITCSGNQVPDGSGGCKDPDPTCSAGQSLVNGTCVDDPPDNTCPTGQKKDASGNCVNDDPSNPNNLVCTGGKIPDASGTRCVYDTSLADDDTEIGTYMGDPLDADQNNSDTGEATGEYMGGVQGGMGGFPGGYDAAGSYSRTGFAKGNLYAETAADKAAINSAEADDKNRANDKDYLGLRRVIDNYRESQRSAEAGKLRRGSTVGGNQASSGYGNLKSGQGTFGSDVNAPGQITSGPKVKDDRPYAKKGMRVGAGKDATYFAAGSYF